MEYQNQYEALNEYLEKAYVEPCKALYEMLSQHSKDAYDFWQVIVPNWKTFAVNGTLTMAVAAFGYSVIQAQSVMAEEDILVTNEPTATRTPRPTATQVNDPRCISFEANIGPNTAFVTWVLEAEGRGGWTLLTSNQNIVDQGRVSTGALGYTHQGEQGVSYELDVLFDGEADVENCGEYSVSQVNTPTSTSTPTNVVTLQPWKTLTPTETGTPDLTVTATFATPVFITLVPTRTPTSAPTVTVTLTPVSDDENNLYLPIAEKS
jgi:hypothetical protein